MLRQRPPGEKPSMAVMFAEPPPVVGTAGGQMAEGALGAAAVVLADWEEVPSPSPGNWSGSCELREKRALIPLLPATEPEGVTDPLVDPVVLVADVPVENEDRCRGRHAKRIGSGGRRDLSVSRGDDADRDDRSEDCALHRALRSENIAELFAFRKLAMQGNACGQREDEV